MRFIKILENCYLKCEGWCLGKILSQKKAKNVRNWEIILKSELSPEKCQPPHESTNKATLSQCSLTTNLKNNQSNCILPLAALTQRDRSFPQTCVRLVYCRMEMLGLFRAWDKMVVWFSAAIPRVKSWRTNGLTLIWKM